MPIIATIFDYICYILIPTIQSTGDENMLNKTVSNIMNAAISHKSRSITFSDRITSRKNYENLIVLICNFIIENDTRNLKFVMFHAHDINSVKCMNVFSVKSNESIDKPVCDTRPIHFALNPTFESF